MRSLLLASWLLLWFAFPAWGVRFVVTVPDSTPADGPVYLAGSLPVAGEWKVDGVALQKQPDGTWAVDLDVPAGQTLEFKFNRGTWETVEKNADGSERGNRTFSADAGISRVDFRVERWADGGQLPGGPAPGVAAASPSVVGRLDVFTVDSAALGGKRTLRVWLPPGYTDDGTDAYDVLYLHDGQNLFDAATSAFGSEWEVDETLTRLIEQKQVRPLIVVGLDHGGEQRIAEYTYAAAPEHGGGSAAKHATFLLDEVMPAIAERYRVKKGPEHTFVGGSSLGGLVSLELARRHPGVFGGVIAMSPSLWWPGEPISDAVASTAGGLRQARVWIDMGAAEDDEAPQRAVQQARRFAHLLTQQGVLHRLMIAPGAEHNEAAWARRFPAAVGFVVGK